MMMTTINGLVLRVTVLCFAALIAVQITGCGPNERILQSASEQSANETPVSANTTPSVASLEDDIETMRTAKFSYIYVIKRKDGEKLDSEDMKVIRHYSAQSNRRVMSDEDRAVVVGTNTAIPSAELVVLYDKFAVTSYMRKPEDDGSTNSNTSEP